MQKRLLATCLPLILFVFFFLGMAVVQFASPDLPDNDGFYHIKLAYLMRTEGLKPSFPYLPLTILNENDFFDHHFLFHVALIPFTFGDLLLGAKWAAVTFASLGFLAIWLLLHRQRVAFAWLWALGLLGISDAFLYRMSITRAQSLSLAVLALGLMWLLEGKYKHVAVLAFLYVWMYDAFPLLFALTCLYSLSILIVDRKLELRPLLYAGAGIALGMLVNPYFPHNITFFVDHIAPKLANATAVSVGNEWYPYDTGQLLKNSLPAWFIFASAIFALGLAGRKMDLRTALALLTSLLFGLMLFQARRFVEYFPAFALIFAAFAWSPLLSAGRSGPVTSTDSAGTRFPSMLQAILPVLMLALFVTVSIVRSIPAAQAAMNRSKPNNLYAGASLWLVQNTPAGERVFQTDWDDFPRLFFYNTHNTYLVGLDPTYMQLYDARLYDAWVNITRGKLPQPSGVIAERFGSHYILTDLDHNDFLRQAANDTGLKEVYRDDQAVVFEITGR
jgi:hypothetical protein